MSKAVDATVGAAGKTKEGVQKAVGKSEQGLGKAADKTAEAAVGDKTSDASVTTRVKADFSKEMLLRDTAVQVDTTDRCDLPQTHEMNLSRFSWFRAFVAALVVYEMASSLAAQECAS